MFRAFACTEVSRAKIGTAKEYSLSFSLAAWTSPPPRGMRAQQSRQCVARRGSWPSSGDPPAPERPLRPTKIEQPLRACGVPPPPARWGWREIVSKQLGSRYRSGRSPDWPEFKNLNAPAVKSEPEADWGRRCVGNENGRLVLRNGGGLEIVQYYVPFYRN
jgi:hypothetical protein